MAESASSRLPPELMEVQLGQIDLLMAMYPDTTTVSGDSGILLEKLRGWCNGESDNPLQNTRSRNLQINLSLDLEGSSATGKPIQLDITVPLFFEGTEPLEPPAPKVRLQQPSWMSRAVLTEMTVKISSEEEDMFTMIEHIKEAATQHLDSQLQSSNNATIKDEPLVRVWFYFPSISTRAKRDDLINHAPGFGLTGFLLAGKPGVLCLEGVSQSVDEYMKFIKTESWSDIPAHHKKVSERYRETGASVTRTFVDMQEITNLVGERRGERANRQDMKALEAWLTGRGLGEAFVKVFI